MGKPKKFLPVLLEGVRLMKEGMDSDFKRIIELQSKHNLLEQKHRALEKSHSQLVSRHENVHATHKELESQVQVLKSRYLSLYQTNRELVTEHVALRRRHHELKSQVESLQQRNGELRSEEETLQQAIGQLKSRFTSIRQRDVGAGSEHHYLQPNDDCVMEDSDFAEIERPSKSQELSGLAGNPIEEPRNAECSQDERPSADVSRDQVVAENAKSTDQITRREKDFSAHKRESTAVAAVRERLGWGFYPNEDPNPWHFQKAARLANLALSRFSKHFVSRLAADVDVDSLIDMIYPRTYFSGIQHTGYAFKAQVHRALFKGFEIADFGIAGGVSRFLESKTRNVQLFEYFRQEIESSSPPSDPDFARYCEKKFRTLCKVVNIRIHWQSPSAIGDGWRQCLGWRVSSYFLNAARAVWLLQKIAFSFETPASIFRVAYDADIDEKYMQSIVNPEDDRRLVPKVGFMITPGFRLGDVIIRSEIYPAHRRYNYFDVSSD